MKRCDYLPLFCRSGFSFLQGASMPQEYACACHEHGYDAFGLCDVDAVYGIVRGWKAARENGLGFVCGCELRRSDGPPIYLLAASLEGWGRLCELISTGRERAQKGKSQLYTEDLVQASTGLLLVHPALHAEPAAEALAQAFAGGMYQGVSILRLADDRIRLQRDTEIARRLGLPQVVAHPAFFHAPERKLLADVMKATSLNLTLEEAAPQLLPNSWYRLLSMPEAARLYREFPAALEACRGLVERCAFSPAQLRYRYPSEMVPPGYDSDRWLAELVWRKAGEFYGQGVPEKVEGQLRHELGLIRELGYADYFLTMHDIVLAARAKGILCQGRGSAANSAVCFVLGITSVDPAHSNMLFERFISRERNEPPDIDVDFEHERREEVIQDIYARYGTARAAMVSAFICYRKRLALRDSCRALGFSREQTDRLSRLFHRHRRDGVPEREVLSKAGLDPDCAQVAMLTRVAAMLCGFPRHLSIHSGGFLISDSPVRRMVPVEPARMPGRSVIQWDKNDIEDTGLLKIDVLALGMLSALRKTFDILRRDLGVDLDLKKIPAEDPQTYKMISAADTIGVFQIESRAQMNILKLVQPRTWYDLVIQVAIVRPGPIQGGMVQPFIRRRRGLEKVEYPAPVLAPILERTLGVPLFQEQVLRLAMAAGGFSPGEAEQLRRAMGTFRTDGRLGPMLERLRVGMKAGGIEDGYAQRIIAQIEGFGEYGFPESHAASFALLSYASAYLKCHHPLAFAAGLINSQPMGFYSVHNILQDALHHGVRVLPVCVNHSVWDCSVEQGAAGPGLRLGFRLVKGLAAESIQPLLLDRAAGAPYQDMEQLMARCTLPRAVIQRLAFCGALDPLFAAPGLGRGAIRARALWAVHAFWGREGTFFDGQRSEGPGAASFPGMNEWELMLSQFRRTSYSFEIHPMEFFREALQKKGYVDSRGIEAVRTGREFLSAGLIVTRQKPATAHGMLFMTLEDEFGLINLAVTPTRLRELGDQCMDESLVSVRLRPERRFDSLTLFLLDICPLHPDSQALGQVSHDFH